MRRFHLVSKLAAKQSGVVSREQLLHLGLRSTAIKRALASGLLLKQLRGVYRVSSAPVTREVRLWIGLLWAGEDAVLSHLTAAWLWKLDGLGHSPPHEIDVTVPKRRLVRSVANLRIRRATILEKGIDVGKLFGFPCTSIARTVVDLASVLPAKELELAFNSAVRKRIENRDAIIETLKRLGPRPGWPALANIIDLDELGVTDSRLEDEVRIALRRAKIPLPMPQLQICDRSGEVIGRFDFAWPEKGVVICCDSWKFHGGKHMFEKDRSQSSALQSRGWCALPVTWRRVTKECDLFIAEVRAALAQGRPISE